MSCSLIPSTIAQAASLLIGVRVVQCGRSEPRGQWLLQGFPNKLGPSFELRMKRCFQVVVTITIFKYLSNMFVQHSSRDTMWNVGDQLSRLHSGDYLAERPVAVLYHSFEMPS